MSLIRTVDPKKRRHSRREMDRDKEKARESVISSGPKALYIARMISHLSLQIF